MATNFDYNVHHVSIYVNNSRDIYSLTEWLTSCVCKRIKKGLSVEADHLAKCSTMQKIVRMATRLASEDGIKVSSEERKEVATQHAAYIMESAKYLASC